MRIISATEDEKKPVRKSIPTLRERQIISPKKTFERGITATIVISILELVHIVSPGTWKRILEVISRLIVTITGLFAGAKT